MGERTRRWGRRALLVLVPAASLYYLVLGGEYSAFDVRRLEATRADAIRRVDSLQAAVDSLAARAGRLERDTLAIERLARERYGFIRDGERLYRFVPREDGSGGEPQGSGGEPQGSGGEPRGSGGEPREGSGVDGSGGRD